MTRILVVEHDDDVARLVAGELEADGYEVERATAGPEALCLVEAVPLDLLVLDIALPGGDGFRMLRTIRDAGNDTPVLVLTVRRAREDKMRAFRLGADDYVTKPFDALELVARVGALLRRARRGRGAVEAAGPPAPLPPIVTFGDVEINRATRVVRRSGEPIALFPMEYELLTALIDRGGAVATRAELLRELWGPRTVVRPRAIDTHVAALRRRLEAVASAPRHILTVRKVGYRFEP